MYYKPTWSLWVLSGKPKTLHVVGCLYQHAVIWSLTRKKNPTKGFRFTLPLAAETMNFAGAYQISKIVESLGGFGSRK